jgi:antagonist of KipI
MSILVQKEGILNTVQDLGRTGKRQFGINPGGVMDRTAVRLLNALIGNDPNDAVVELHFPAGVFVFETDVNFAVGGADFGPELSGRKLASWTVQLARAGDVLKFRTKLNGNRTYISVARGINVDHWLGSASTNLAAGIGGFEGRRLKPGDRLKCEGGATAKPVRLGESLIPAYTRAPVIRIIPGPELDRVTGLSVETLINEWFRVGPESNRMGFRLNGPTLGKLVDTEMLSSGAAFGTIQLLPDGQLVVLMADHQTTGGYPRIANVSAVDLPLLAQLGSGDHLRFELINVTEAEELAQRLERNIAFLQAGVDLSAAAQL